MTDVQCSDCKRPIGVPPEEYQEGIEYRCLECELTANRTMDKKMLQVITDYKAKIDRLEVEIAAKDKVIVDLVDYCDAKESLIARYRNGKYPTDAEFERLAKGKVVLEAAKETPL